MKNVAVREFRYDHIFDDSLSYRSRLLSVTVLSNNKLKYCVKLPLIAIATLTGVPYINAAGTFAGDNKVLKVIYGYSITGSLSVLSSWALLDFFKYYEQVWENEPSKLKKGIFILLPTTVGIFASLPGTIISLHYNTAKFFAALAFAGDFIGNTCSLNRIMYSFYNGLKIKFTYGNEFVDYRSIVIKRLELGLKKFAAMSKIQVEELLRHHDLINYHHSNIHSDFQYNNILNFLTEILVLGSSAELEQSNLCCIHSKNILINLLSLIIPLGWAPTGFKLVVEGMSNLVDNTALSYFIAITASTPGYILESMLTNMILYNFYNLIESHIYKSYLPSFAQVTYPKLFYSVMLFGLATASFCFATRAQVINDEQNGIYHDIVLPWVIISTIMYKSSAMISFIPSFLSYIASKSTSSLITTSSNIIELVKGVILNTKEVSATNFIFLVQELCRKGLLDKIIQENSRDGKLINALVKLQEKFCSLQSDSQAFIEEGVETIGVGTSENTATETTELLQTEDSEQKTNTKKELSFSVIASNNDNKVSYTREINKEEYSSSFDEFLENYLFIIFPWINDLPEWLKENILHSTPVQNIMNMININFISYSQEVYKKFKDIFTKSLEEKWDEDLQQGNTNSELRNDEDISAQINKQYKEDDLLDTDNTLSKDELTQFEKHIIILPIIISQNNKLTVTQDLFSKNLAVLTFIGGLIYILKSTLDTDGVVNYKKDYFLKNNLQDVLTYNNECNKENNNKHYDISKIDLKHNIQSNIFNQTIIQEELNLTGDSCEDGILDISYIEVF